MSFFKHLFHCHFYSLRILRRIIQARISAEKVSDSILNLYNRIMTLFLKALCFECMYHTGTYDSTLHLAESIMLAHLFPISV